MSNKPASLMSVPEGYDGLLSDIKHRIRHAQTRAMLAFYREYPHLEFVQQAVAQIDASAKVPQAAALFSAELVQALPWGHHAELMIRAKDLVVRQWYMQAAISNPNMQVR